MDNVLVEVTRGPIAENLVRGHIAVISEDGLIAGVGDPRHFTHMRSTAKPVQATVVIESGAADAFGFTDREIAVMCSSHIAESCHVEAVESILEKIGLTEENLLLYKDYSLSPALREKRIADHEPMRLIYNNCSGKHASMLAVCRHLGLPIDSYYELSHPVQQRILGIISEYAEYPREKIVTGLDGCGVPVFAMPLENIARTYLNLAHPENLPERHQRAAERVVRSITEYPEYLFGSGFLSTELIRATGGRIICKVGSDGVFALSSRAEKLALAIKIESGDMWKVKFVVMEALRQLGLLTKEETEQLSPFSKEDTVNCHGLLAGTTRPVFTLETYPQSSSMI